MKITIFLAAYNACSGMTDFGDALRIVFEGFPGFQFGIASTLQNDASKRHECLSKHKLHAKGSKLTRQGSLVHSSDLCPILSRSIAPGLQSVVQFICLFKEPTRASILGACSLGVLLTILAARLHAFENTIASCFVPKCWVGFLSVLRVLSLGVRSCCADFAC